MIRQITAALLIAFAAHPAAAQITAGELNRRCTGEALPGLPEISINACEQYLAGMIDMHNVYRQLPETMRPTQFFCLPADGVAPENARGLLASRLMVNPADKNSSAGLIVALMLQDAFPCPTPSRRSTK